MDGEDAPASEFQERLDMLKAIGDPIFLRSVFWMSNLFFSILVKVSSLHACFSCFRYNELTARPAALEHARQYLTDLQQVVRFVQ